MNGNKEDNDDKIKLPPLPDEAVEFDPLSLEAMVDLDDTDAQEAELAAREAEAEGYIPPEEDMVSLALKDLVSGGSEEPVIVTDPMPTPVDPEKEFDPTSTQNALDDFDEEGGVRKAVAKGPTLTKSASKEVRVNLGGKVSDYNPGTVQDALQDSSIEGGVVSNKSTGSMKTPDNDSAKDGQQVKSNTIDKNSEFSRYRVYGFNVQFLAKNSYDETIVVTRQVSDFFDDQTKAMISVNGSKYLMPMENGSFEVVDIVSGTPQISLGDQNLYTYAGEKKIGEGGYWKRS
jgi:hypothetical protein